MDDVVLTAFIQGATTVPGLPLEGPAATTCYCCYDGLNLHIQGATVFGLPPGHAAANAFGQ